MKRLTAAVLIGCLSGAGHPAFARDIVMDKAEEPVGSKADGAEQGGAGGSHKAQAKKSKAAAKKDARKAEKPKQPKGEARANESK